ncbi:hypothetical protein KSP40_PGU011037 [Platanthera guangdongensis]|uniref:Late embryogenesis abundant protein LEA-2 subgroup domain-containing protein n=1 Tax=Platanthera guangdongensis TaxID=2320717 RepID=A0ABR2MTM6_9ASPA
MESKKFFKVCYIASTIILIIFIVIVVILCFTIFKPKQPEIGATPVSLTNIKFTLAPNITLSLSLRTDVALRNPNYAGFKYKNSTTYVYYGGNLVGDAAIREGIVAARSTKRIGTVVTIRADEVIESAEFLADIMGSLNMMAK